MTSDGWLRDSADERLQGLFSDDSEEVRVTVRDLIAEAFADPEVEELLVDTLEASLRDGNDDTSASAWMAVILGETRCVQAIGALVEAISGEDEMLAAAASRALRRIGQPAFAVLLDMLEGDDLGSGLYVAVAECLEGLRLHDLGDERERAIALLTQRVLTPAEGREGLVRIEAAALALARLGEQDARTAIELAAERLGRTSSSFLHEALEILDAQPQGIPCASADPWDDEFRWALGPDLPGGELARPGDEASTSRRRGRRRPDDPRV